ncbi:hypothetical protein HK100_003131, partial [Physocladia obscura]
MGKNWTDWFAVKKREQHREAKQLMATIAYANRERFPKTTKLSSNYHVRIESNRMWGFGSSSSANNQHATTPPALAQSASSASSATTVSTHEQNGGITALTYTYKIQIFPHREGAQLLGTIPGSAQAQRFHFDPVERDLKPGMMLKIGRKVDKKVPLPIVQPPDEVMSDEAVFSDGPGVLPSSYQSASDQPPSRPSVVDLSQTAAAASRLRAQPAVDFVAFKSKVVSRAHAELWVSDDGQVMFRDVGSSSGTWVNRHRLSPSGKESRPYVIKSGDVVQLGMDYQGRQEDMYKSVVMKIFVTMRSKEPPKPNPARLRASLRALLSAMNPSSVSSQSTSCTDCCICLSPLSPLQTLFLAPCSHCFHFRCVMPLLGSSVMFQCPLCRQVANLEKGVAEDEESLCDDDEVNAPVPAGETSLEEWLGVLRVDDNEQIGGTSSVGGNAATSSAAPGVVGATGGGDTAHIGSDDEDDDGHQSDEEVLRNLEVVLGDVVPGLDEEQRKLALERF